MDQAEAFERKLQDGYERHLRERAPRNDEATLRYVRYLESQNQALQERAEKAEAVLETLVVAHAADLPASHDAALTLARDYRNALSPTQETDEHRRPIAGE